MKETNRKKQTFLNLFIAILAIGFLTGLGSCTKETGEEANVTAVSLETSSNNVVIGIPFQLTTTIAPEGAVNSNLIWLSSDETIATVSAGIVTGISPGIVTITAISQANSAIRDAVTLEIVPTPIPATALLIEAPSSSDLEVGETTQLTVAFTPANATTTAVIWSVNDPSRATVDDTGLVTAIASGPVTVTATLEDDQSILDAIPLYVLTTESIISFTFGEMPSVQPVITDTEVIFEIDFNTEFKNIDVSALTPTITQDGVSINPPSGVVQDFRGGPVDYNLITTDGRVRTYAVSVRTKPGTEFITTWNTQNITIIGFTDFFYDYNVDLNNDGYIDMTGVDVNANLTLEPGGGTIRISGRFPNIRMFNAPNRDNLTSLDQWGTIDWFSMREAFSRCDNLEVPATDSPNLSRVADMTSMFRDSGKANPDVSDWDTSNVTNMSGMFFLASSANPDVSTWNISSVTNMLDIFRLSQLSLVNYEAALNRFADHANSGNGLSLPQNINFGSVPVRACSSEAISDRSTLQANGWTISENSSFNCP